MGWLSSSPGAADVRRDLVFFRCCKPCMRMAAITTFVSASLFLDSIVGSSGCDEIVSTRDRFERFPCASAVSFRLSGLISAVMLGDRESWRDDGRDKGACADGGRESGCGETLESIDIDFRCTYGRCDSFARAAAAAMPSPPLPLAFLFAIVASSNRSRLRLGDFGAPWTVCSGGKN
jgi:hypothetical protein